MAAVKNIPIVCYGQKITGLFFTIGETVNFLGQVLDPDTRDPVNLTGANIAGSIAPLEAGDAPGTPIVSRQATITDIPQGLFTWPLASGDTVPMVGDPATPTPIKAGSYLLDLWYTDADGNRLATLLTTLIDLFPCVTVPNAPVTPLPSQDPLAEGPPGPAPTPPAATGTFEVVIHNNVLTTRQSEVVKALFTGISAEAAVTWPTFGARPFAVSVSGMATDDPDAVIAQIIESSITPTGCTVQISDPSFQGYVTVTAKELLP